VKFTTFCVKEAFVARRISRLVAAGEVVSFAHVRLTAAPAAWAVSPEGTAGETLKTIGRIISISSWLSMWQCHMYSQPKLTKLFVTVTASAV